MLKPFICLHLSNNFEIYLNSKEMEIKERYRYGVDIFVF